MSFANPLAAFVYHRTYARWLEAARRRETWDETVARYVAFMKERLGERVTAADYEAVTEAIRGFAVMPSMRLLWSAGPAAARTNVSAYNCAYLAPSCPADFGEIMYLLMCGTGVGFSVEAANIARLPAVAPDTGRRRADHAVEDSKDGWCDALTLGLTAWFAGEEVAFDLSGVRAYGTRLATMGGRASGPEALSSLLGYARASVRSHAGRRMPALAVHDLICRIGASVAMGGVRRAALISLSDLDDEAMANAKTGTFFREHPERAYANDSAAYGTRPSRAAFAAEWRRLRDSGTGERGLFNRGGLLAQMPERRRAAFRAHVGSAGTNPCGEIVLRSKQFCNLSEVVARSGDDVPTLEAKVRLAALIGTFQAMLTEFPYLSAPWTRNCVEERLLGVSITGHWDCPAVRDRAALARLREAAVTANARYATAFGVAPAAAVTCVKPSGTVSLLVDAAAGLHPRYARYYVRRIRIAAADPLLAMLRAQGMTAVPEVGEAAGTARTYVLEFPVAAPRGAVVTRDLSALAQLAYWRDVKVSYTEHNPSITVFVREEEWDGVESWVWENWDLVGGLTFLPYTEHRYELAPYEEISGDEYARRAAAMPAIDYGELGRYETAADAAEDGTGPVACEASGCGPAVEGDS